jgi:hypothetical protein
VLYETKKDEKLLSPPSGLMMQRYDEINAGEEGVVDIVQSPASIELNFVLFVTSTDVPGGPVLGTRLMRALALTLKYEYA